MSPVQSPVHESRFCSHPYSRFHMRWTVSVTLMRDPCIGSWILHCLALGIRSCHASRKRSNACEICCTWYGTGTCITRSVSSPDHYSYDTWSGNMLQDSWAKRSDWSCDFCSLVTGNFLEYCGLQSSCNSVFPKAIT